jgi:1,4-alpha-glucan branching enzyme
VVQLTTATEYLTHNPPEEVMAVPESSWGTGGGHWVWDNPETRWMWEPIHAAEMRMEDFVGRYASGTEDTERALNQAARELLLLQSSDWPFLVTTGQASQYAIQRFRGHLDRFTRLLDLLEDSNLPEAARLTEGLYEADKVFPDIDYRWFGEQAPATFTGAVPGAEVHAEV